MNVRGSIYWSFVSQALIFIISFGNTVALARILTPHEFGIFAIAVAAQAVVQIFVNFGVSAYVTQHENLTPGVLTSAFTVNAIVLVIFTTVLFSVSFFTQPLLGNADAGSVLRILAISALVNIFAFRSTAMLAREMAFKVISLVTLLSVMVTAAVTLGSALLGASYMSAAWGILAGSVLQAFMYNILGFRHISLRVSLAGSREIFRFGMTMSLLSGASALAARMSEIVLGRVQGMSALGLYSRATGITAIIQDNIYATATKISYVKMADESRKTGSLGPTLLRSLQLITGLLWPVQIGLAVTAGPVIRFMYGDKWTMASTPLSFILIAQAIMLMFGMNWEVFTLTGNLPRQAKLEITRTALGAIAFLICAQFSLVAAAASRVLEALIGLFLYRGKIAELAKVEQSQLRRIYGEGALLTICAVLPVLILMMIWHWSALTPLAPLFACIGTGVALWLVGLHVLRHPLREEMQVIIRSVRGRLSTAAKG